MSVVFRNKVVDPARVRKIRGETSGAPASGNRRLSNQELLSTEALAVHPSQVAEAERGAQMAGIDVTFDRETGIPSFRRHKDHDRYFKEAWKVMMNAPEGYKL